MSRRVSFQDPMHNWPHILREQLLCFGFKEYKFLMYQSTIERPAASMVYTVNPSSFATTCKQQSHTHTHRSTIQVCACMHEQKHMKNALFLKGLPDSNTGDFYSFLHQLFKLLVVSFIPVRSLLSPRWQTSASPSVARSSCRVASPVC